MNMEPENTALEEENHLPNHHFQVLCSSSGVYTFLLSFLLGLSIPSWNPRDRFQAATNNSPSPSSVGGLHQRRQPEEKSPGNFLELRCYTTTKTNMTMAKQPWMKMYLSLKNWWFSIVMLVCLRVTYPFSKDFWVHDFPVVFLSLWKTKTRMKRTPEQNLRRFQGDWFFLMDSSFFCKAGFFLGDCHLLFFELLNFWSVSLIEHDGFPTIFVHELYQVGPTGVVSYCHD